MLRRNLLALAAALAASVVLPAAAQAPAAEFPSRPVRILTPFPAGAGPDAMLRSLAERLQKRWGKPVIVENKPGANGFLAIEAFKRGATDGHDLIQLDSVHLTTYPHLFKKLPYEARAFDLLGPLFRTYFYVAVPTASPYRTVGDLIADAKARPTQLNYGSWSVGNPVHLGSALLESMTGTQMQHVIYKEVPMLYTGVANGELHWALGSVASAGPMQRAGKVRWLAVAAPRRQAAFPDVPTVAESGGPAGYEVTGWTMLAAPRGLSPALSDKLHRDLEATLAEPEMKERLQMLGYEPFPTTREAFAAYIGAESKKAAALVERTKASLD